MSTTFEVHSGVFSDIAWTVLSIVGEEAISEQFKFTVQVQADHDKLAEKAAHLEAVDRALVGQRVSFRLREGGLRRYGIVSAARIEATPSRGDARWAQLSIEVVPRAYLLTQRRNSRIFQGVYLHQIVSHVLCESGVSHRWAIEQKLPRRAFCTQYDETDWEFLTRLFAEEGMLFYFEHSQDFAGGPEPTKPEEKSWTDGLKTAAQVLGGGGAVVSAIGGMGDSKGFNVVSVIGAAANVAGDLIKPIPKDEEDDDPWKPHPGLAGPAGWAPNGDPAKPTLGTDVLVFTDQAAYAPIPQGELFDGEVALTLRDSGGMEADEDAITELWPTGRLRTRKARAREFDFRRPMFVLASEFRLRDDADVVPDMPVDGTQLPDAYAHHSQYDKPYLPHDTAHTRLQQLRADAATLGGRGHCSQMWAGGTFTLTNAKEAQLKDTRFAVVRVRHELHAPQVTISASNEEQRFAALARGCARAIHEALSRRELPAEEALGDIIRQAVGGQDGLRPQRTYRNRFECVAVDRVFRPAPPPPLVRNVFESAIVVGPRGLPPPAPSPPDPNDPGSGDAAKEIYTDKYGRVKVQFHWDLEGTYDEHSSCWVRPSQAWAGAGFGFQFIPRVGMEVLVGFLRGDPDRPVILGAVYNATHATPEPLPQRNTRSAIRTQTSPGGGGFNELAFEDGRGVERVMIHAQKDFEETVNDTHTINVKNHQKVTVASGQQIEVGGDRLVAVGGKQATLVGGGEATHVRGNRTVDVSGNETYVVAGNALRSVKGVLAESVEADALSSVGGDHNLVVRGSSITQVGGKDPQSEGSAVTYVQGRSIVTATKGALIRAGEGAQVRLECGKSFIEIGPQKITLSAPSVEVLGGDKVRLASKDSHLALDQDSASLQSKSAGISTPDGTKMKVSGKDAMVSAPGKSTTEAQGIDLKSGGGGGDKDKDKKDDQSQSPNLTLTFFHGHEAATLRGTRYRVVIDDLVQEGKTSAAGEVKVYAPESAKVAFVILWANETFAQFYPSGPLQWLVHLVPTLDLAITPAGARMRLRNLGYDPGGKLDKKEVDDATRAALLEFQLDRGLPPTGALEGETEKKLKEAYGS